MSQSRKRLTTTFAAAALALSMGPAVGSLSYFGFDEFGGTWSDAEKSPSNADDDLMCWAAGASNILEWTGWGAVGGGLGNTDAIFAYFQDHWTDNGGNPYFGWEWWFTGVYNGPTTASWSQVDVPGGGFWTASEFDEAVFFNSDDPLALPLLDALLRQGYGVTFSIVGTRRSLRHGVGLRLSRRRR
jgi:hypothetical protein